MSDSRAAELIVKLQEAGDKLRDIREIPEDKRDDKYAASLSAQTRMVEALDREEKIAARIEARQMEQAAWDHAVANPPAPESRGPQAAFSDLEGEHRTAGQQVTESFAYKAKERGAHLGDVEIRNLLTGSSAGTSGSNLFVPVGTPYLSQGAIRRQRLFVRDVLSVQNTNLASVPYIRELNAATNEGGALTVKEASAKPEVTMEFEQDDAPIRKIAAWIQATMEALDDAPTLRGYVDTRLAYMLMLREEQQVLTGTGTAPQIKGIKTYSTTQSATGTFYDGVAESIGKVELVDGYPNAVVANAGDFWAAVRDRHSEDYDGQAFGSAPFGTPTRTAWGLPVVSTRSLSSGDAIVGDFALGATMFEKEGVVIRSTDSHASNFTSNIIVIVAEERVGLAVHRPDFFVELTVTAPS